MPIIVAASAPSAPATERRLAALAVDMASSHRDADLSAFYLAPEHGTLWIVNGAVRPEAEDLLALLAQAGEDGLNPDSYRPALLRAKVAAAAHGDPVALAEAEVSLSRAYADYITDLRRPAPGAEMIFTDPSLRPPRPDRLAALDAAARAPDLRKHLREARRMNFLYEGLRRALAEHRRHAATSPPDERARAAAEEAVLLANLERARALPRELGERFVLVDAASATLWLYEGGKARRAMRVIVGAPDQQTPVMAGTISHAVFNPVWNIPEDLVATRIAPAVLREGLAYLEGEDLEILSDWSDRPSQVDPASVDWHAVAAGRLKLRVRQRPGPDNMMGTVKLMLPNELGIYLHDTPDRQAFRAASRTLSAGCVRLEDAGGVAAWLLGTAIPATPPQEPEHRVDLRTPTPVYITYFTALPVGSHVKFQPDVYSRDESLLTRVYARRPASQKQLSWNYGGFN